MSTEKNPTRLARPGLEDTEPALPHGPGTAGSFQSGHRGKERKKQRVTSG